MHSKSVVIGLVFLFQSLTSCASTTPWSSEVSNLVSKGQPVIVETPELKFPAEVARQLVKKHGKEKVLVVFDLDNTLLTSNHPLGGVGWYDWQAANLKKQDFNDRVASDFPELFDVMGKLFALGSMKPTQKDSQSIVRALQAEGIDSLILTARGTEYRSMTEREMTRNGIDFMATAPGPEGGFGGRYYPYKKEAKNSEFYFKNKKYKKPRLVSYMEGVYMTAGQHKGLMLSRLLKRMNKSYPVVVFIDDAAKNVKRMQEGFDPKKTTVYGFRYSRMDKKVERFHNDPSKAIQGWKKISQTLNQVYGTESSSKK